MKERAAELTKEKRGKASKADGLADLLEKVAEMPESDRIMAERIHTLVMEAAPDLREPGTECPPTPTRPAR